MTSLHFSPPLSLAGRSAWVSHEPRVFDLPVPPRRAATASDDPFRRTAGLSARRLQIDGSPLRLEATAAPDAVRLLPVLFGRIDCEHRPAGTAVRLRSVRTGHCGLVFDASTAGVTLQAVEARLLDLVLPGRTLVRVAEETGNSAGAFRVFDPCLDVLHSARLSRLAQGIAAELEADADLAPLMADAFAVQLCLALLADAAAAAPAGLPRRGGLSPWQMRKIIACLHENLDTDIRLETLADLAGLSLFHFARAFKQSTGLPPHRYLRLLRLERAKTLLRRTEAPVVEIALAIGYESAQTLTRTFRREVGVTPSAYRRHRA
jgi:AraC family transcriptional regulator